MKKSKYIMMFLFVMFMILIPATMVNAYEDTWTYGEGENAVTVKKVVNNDDGTILFEFTNINVEAGKNYEWGVGTSSDITSVEKWYTLVENYPDSKKANITLLSSDYDMRKFLRSNISAYIFIRNKNNAEQFLINKLKVDLTLPPLKAYKIDLLDDRICINDVYYIGRSNIFYQFEKITDEAIVNEYLEKRASGKDFSEIKTLKSLSDVPTSNWTKEYWIWKSEWPKEEGLYYVWVQSQDSESKKIVGYTLFYGDANAPKVNSIQVYSPNSGTYKTGQTVKIRACFSEKITGETVPTLIIKFGASPERSLTNGTIKSADIEYSYDIQDTDVGQLATVSFEGGKIKDETGNDAKLSCPIISGNTIKANVDGTTTTQTDNQDKTEDKTTDSGTTSDASTTSGSTTDETTTASTDGTTTGDTTTDTTTTTTTETSGTTTSNGGSTTVTQTTATTSNEGSTTDTSSTTTAQPSSDSTAAPTILPNTGGKTIVFVVISVILATGVFAYFYFVKFKDVK